VDLRLSEVAHIREAATFTIIMLITMTAMGLYQGTVDTFRATIQRLIVAYGLALMIMSVAFYVFPSTYVGRGVFAITSALSLIGILISRLIFFRLTDLGLAKRRVLVLGSGAAAQEVMTFLHESDRSRAVQYAGSYPVLPESSTNGAIRRIDHAHLMRTIRLLNVSEIVIAVRDRRGGVLPLRELIDCKLQGIRILDLVSFYERERNILKIDNLRASWLIFGEGFSQGLLRDVLKRLFDMIVSLILLVLTIPIALLAMLAILIESGFPVIYRQTRSGQGGANFPILKLRSMRTDAEKDGKPRWAGQNDSRVTRVGRILRRTRIDELPQLFNVLWGDMSFVGPRPERPYFVQSLVEKIPYYDIRHNVKPGITGWSQVRYQYGASVEDALEKLQFDLYYVKNHSMFLDFLILVETMQVVLFGKGAR
jgi:sugar transferase (PEP-CTERM system associated)